MLELPRIEIKNGVGRFNQLIKHHLRKKWDCISFMREVKIKMWNMKTSLQNYWICDKFRVSTKSNFKECKHIKRLETSLGTKESLVHGGFHRTPSLHRFHNSIGGNMFISLSSQETMESLAPRWYSFNEGKFDIVSLVKKG